ncbi:HAD family hydrolase [Canibacter zhoujuaniae]|uniref:HAD family hydrolase n=1 Tax=Canibacter zhoujuaniae TaxID=2708343 RepID=UPI0014232469|nr:HAD family hydrolase [Canibacter zhoujuaniae]
MNSKYLIALDLDGTVLHHDASIDDDLVLALQKLHAHPDFELVIATGRSFDATLTVVEKLGIRPEWLACSNGAVLYRATRPGGHYGIAKVHTFDPEPLLRKIKQELPAASLAVESPDGHFYSDGKFETTILPLRHYHVEFEILVTFDAVRIVGVSSGHASKEFIRAIDRLGLHSVTYTVGDSAWLDIVADGINKAVALEPLRASLGVPRANVFAAGDGENDIEMIAWAAAEGCGVAMGQGSADAFEAANFVTGGITEGGLLQALKGWEPAARVLAAAA